MIAFKDFVPDDIEEEGFFKRAKMETLQEALRKANDWIQESRVNIINVETIVLPNMHYEEGSEDVELRVSGDYASHWNQFIRVWYES